MTTSASASTETTSLAGRWTHHGFADGPLFFPLTPFTSSGTLDTAALQRHVAATLEHGVGGVFVACGTGELPALSPAEQAAAVRATRAVTPVGIPLFAGAGGGYGTTRAQILAALEAGADGILLFPPYLVAGTVQGQLDLVAAATDGVDVPVIVYRRGTSLVDATTVAALAEIPAVAGIKDGRGDVAAMGAIVQAFAAARPERAGEWEFFNGVPTAEMQVAAYAEVGVTRYSSAVLALVPEVAVTFYRAFRAGDNAVTARLLDGFYRPLVALRDEKPGFAVALIKAGHALVGEDLGRVRPPLEMPNADQMRRLGVIIEAGRRLVAEVM